MKKTAIRFLNALSVALLCIAMCISFFSIGGPGIGNAAWNGSVAASFASGSGTETSPYLIKTTAQMGYFMQKVAEGATYEGQYIRLENSLDMTGATWNYTHNVAFQGNFNGNGYTITADCPLFGDIGEKGSVKGLNYTAAKEVDRALLCDYNYGTIDSCVFYGTVLSDWGATVHAGMICTYNRGTIVNCGAIGTVTADADDTSAYAAMVPNNSGTISNCFSALEVNAYRSGKYSVAKKDPLTLGSTVGCYYDKNLFTGTAQSGVGLTTAEMKSAGFLASLVGTSVPGTNWVAGSHGYPELAHCSTAYAYVDGYKDQKTIVYFASSESFTLYSTNSTTIYYTLDGSDPTVSSTRKSVSSGHSVSITGDAVLTVVPWYNNNYGTISRLDVISLPGSGTEADPYRISTKKQLSALKMYPDKCFRIVNNITFTAADYAFGGVMAGGWVPVDEFSGTLDGQGYAITGLEGKNGGLIDTNAGTVKALRLVDHKLYAYSDFGTIAEYNTGNITQCYVRSAFTEDTLPEKGTSNANRMGGIAASNIGSITYCRNEGITLFTGAHKYAQVYVGGICGYDNGTVQNCVNTGTVILQTSAHADNGYVGGIVGYGFAMNCLSDTDFIIEQSFDYNVRVGGISGQDPYFGSGANYCISSTPSVALRVASYSQPTTYKYTFAASYGDHCYVLDKVNVPSECPKLDFENEWMLTKDGLVPQGVMDADGHCYVAISGSLTEPACNTSGSVLIMCYVCTRTETQTIPATGDHPYENGFCTVCGEYEPATQNEDGVYEIGNAGQLFWFAEEVKTYRASNGELTNSITIPDGMQWTPVTFWGKFNGNGFSISNMHYSGSDYYSGMFAQLESGAEVRDLHITNSSFTSTSGYIGAIAGYAYDAVITDCSVTNTTVTGETAIGGIVGMTQNYCEVKNCGVSEITVTSNNSTTGYAGGIAGQAVDGVDLIGCAVESGTVNANRAGGILGYGWCNAGPYAGRDITISRCSSSADVGSSTSRSAGGIMGELGTEVDLYMNNCWSSGKVTCSSSDTEAGAGGMLGTEYQHQYTKGSIQNCYSIAKLSGYKCGYMVSNSLRVTYKNCYSNYSGLSSTHEAYKTEAQFASGEVAYLLQGDQTAQVWGQSLGNEAYPVLSDYKVYQVSGCGGTQYSNMDMDAPHNFTEASNGFCTVCDAYEPATQNEDGVYEIGNAGQLYWFAKLVNDGTRDADAIVVADITVNENLIETLQVSSYDGSIGAASTADIRKWTPIGAMYYTGSFDGNRKTISGLYYYGTQPAGFFCILQDTAVSNMVVTDSYFYTTASSLGGIAAVCENADIADCYFDGVLNINLASSAYAGGIVGYFMEGSITDCTNAGDVFGSSNLGGIAGYADDNKSPIENCTNTGTIRGDDWIGGIVGDNYSAVTGCSNEGEIIGSGGEYIGGIVGYNNYNVSDCVNSGKVSGSTVGGIAGTNGYKIDACENAGEIIGSSYAGGIAGVNQQKGYNDFQYAGAITDCVNSGTVTITGGYWGGVGGVAGINKESAVIADCHNEGKVTYVVIYDGESADAGGVVGYNTGTVTGCDNSGEVSGNRYVGGIAGRNYCVVDNCYNTGDIHGKKYVGGIVGSSEDANIDVIPEITVTNCYNAGAVTGESGVGGIAGELYSGGKESYALNCYYMEGTAAGGVWGEDVPGAAEMRTAAQFASGQVAYELQGSQSQQIWGQEIGKDRYPLFSGNKVYKKQVGGCNAESFLYEYSNTQAEGVTTHNWLEATCVDPETCDDCGETRGEAAGHSTGAEGDRVADCENPAYCHVCGMEYGEKDSTNHTSASRWMEDNQDGTHSVYYGCCDALDYTENHSGDPATCSKKQWCNTCCIWFGELDPDNHAFNTNSQITPVEGGHGVVCSECENPISVESHTGGSATCNKAATCEVCNAEYGAVAPGNHEGNTNEQYVEEGPGHALFCSECGEIIFITDHHGGTATCDLQAQCVACGVLYGELNAENHAGNTNTEITAVEGGHGVVCSQCEQPMSVEDHSGGTATCQTKAVCDICGTSYGDFDGDNHESEYYTCSDIGNGSHLMKHDCCGAEAGVSNHVGGDATCSTQAVCEECNASYGDYNSTNHKYNTSTEIVAVDGGHGVVCSACHQPTYVEAHKGGSATCTQQAKCEVCGVYYGTTSGGHNYDNGFCTACGGYQEAAYVDGVYEISNAGQLYWFAQLVNSGSTRVNGKLKCDVNLNPGYVFHENGTVTKDNVQVTGGYRSWIPIANNSSVSYRGDFEGDGHSISGIYLNNAEADYVGLFGYVSLVKIRNVAVINSYLRGRNEVGGIAGYCEGNISNCSSAATICGTRHVGGISGYLKGSIVNCYNTGTATCTDACIGGVVGSNSGIIRNCYNTGNVVGNSSYVGGIAGITGNYGQDGTITTSYNIGAVSGGLYTGGIAGNASDNISSCYYLDTCVATSSTGTAKTAAQFASGEVAYLLQGSQTDQIWGQEIGKDSYPVFSNHKVYRNITGGCTEASYTYEYSNTQSAPVTTHDWRAGNCETPENCARCGATRGNMGSHTYDNGFCTACDAYEPAVLNSQGVYEISNGGQLFWFAQKVNGGSTSANGKLKCDVNLNPGYVFHENGTVTKDNVQVTGGYRSWTPIANTTSVFYRGEFEGDGHSISGIYINNAEADYVGLFGAVGWGDSKIWNVSVMNSYISGRNYVGGVSGYSEADMKNCSSAATVCGVTNVGGVSGYIKWILDSCYNTGHVSGTGNNVGGVVGDNDHTIQNCYNAGYVSGTGNNVGGVVGDNNSTIRNCYNTGMVTSTGQMVGGIAGSSFGNMSICYNAGQVSASYDHVGGIAGISYGSISNCYNTGSVSSMCNYVGGLVGINYGSLVNSYNRGYISGNAYLGGVAGGNFTSSTITNCYYLSGVCAGGIDGRDISGSAEVRTETQFASGEVAYLLQGDQTDQIWGQEIGKDSYPVFSNHKVYRNQTGGCNAANATYSYSNTQADPVITHASNEFTYQSISSGEHNIYYKCCGAYVNTLNHTANEEGRANCSQGNTCEYCGGVFGNPDPQNHNPSVAFENGFCDNGCYEPCGGKGTEADPYTIANGGQLYWFAAVLNQGYGDVAQNSRAQGKLVANIVVNNTTVVSNGTLMANTANLRTWTPIAYYNGVFDGQGYKISGLYCNVNSEKVGLFGYASDSYIKNLGMENSYFHGSDYVGSILGQGSSTLDNCRIVGDVLVEGQDYVGGLAGRALNMFDCTGDAVVRGRNYVGGFAGTTTAEVERCHTNARVEGTDYVGGLVGRGNRFEECSYMGNVQGTRYVGGIVGEFDSIVTKCYNAGMVYGDTIVGGVAGYLSPGNMYDCYNVGWVTGSAKVGGLAGSANASIWNCYSRAKVTGTTDTGAIAGYVSSGITVTNCYYLDGIDANGVFAEDVAGSVEKCTAAQFASGEVCWLLQEERSEQVWGQTIATMSEPQFYGGRVYRNITGGCTVDSYVYSYSNTQAVPVLTHDWELHGSGCSAMNVCKRCGVETPANNGEHSTGAEGDRVATCAHGAYCSVCQSEYGSPDLSNHDTTVAYVNGFCPYCDAYEPCGGAGTIMNPYTIGNGGQLYWFAAVVNTGYGDVAQNATARAILVADITVNQNVLVDGELNPNASGFRTWTPIGTGNVTFNTIFDGQNHTISGLYLNTDASIDAGLFGYTGMDSAVRNVTVADSYFRSQRNAGGIVGSANGPISNCVSYARVSSTNSFVGGIAGSYNGNAPGITDCTNYGNVSGKNNVGGIVGGCIVSVIRNCVNEGNVSGESSVGGILGHCAVMVYDCTNKGDVTGTADYVGGISGNGGSIEGCRNEGNISGASYVGGMSGNSSTVVQCTNIGDVTGTGDYVGGFVGQGNSLMFTWNEGTVRGSHYVGGIVGKLYGNISNGYNSGDVIATGNKVGGVAGEVNNGNLGILSNTGNVTGHSYVGGIVGDMRGGSMRTAYNTGNVTGSLEGECAGGIAGYSSGEIVSTHNVGVIQIGIGMGGIVGATESTVTGSYYLEGTASGGIMGQDVPGSAEGKSAEAFASGEVAWLLLNTVGGTWGQKIGTDPWPIYSMDPICRNQTGGCTEDSYTYGYSNTPAPPVTTHDWETSGNVCENGGTCRRCGATTDGTGHSAGAAGDLAATCMNPAYCHTCGTYYGDINPDNHTWITHTEGAFEATCTEDGYTGDQVCECGVVVTVGEVIPATGHDYVDGECAHCGETDPDVPTEPQPTEPQPTEPQPTEPQPTEPQPTEPQPTEPQPTEPQPTEPEPTEPEPTEPEPSEPADPGVEGVIRLAGANRYATGFAVANQLKQTLGVDKFQAAVVAYGQNFPDALTGSYLAAVKNAPILLTEPSQDASVLGYLNQNLVPGGTIYILGGTAAVSQNFEDMANAMGFNAKRLKGAGRYETNLAILKEAGVNKTDEVLIATGKNYADSLSASATGLPMLLVDKELTDSQRAFLVTTSCKFVILGGTGAVSAEIADQLSEIGTVTRVKGASRYGTSVAIAQRYFPNASAAVLAYAQGFPDGLCGGPLALSMGAPLILTSNESYQMADDYVAGITTGVVTGGTGRISDDTVREIFDLPGNTPIVKP